MVKLNAKLRAREPLNRCQDPVDMITSVEALGDRSLAELASLHGLCLDPFPDQNDTRDVVTNHFLLGECTKANGIFCEPFPSTSSPCSSGRISSNDLLPTQVMEGMLKSASKNALRRVLRLIGLSYSPTESISVHHSLLRCLWLPSVQDGLASLRFRMVQVRFRPAVDRFVRGGPLREQRVDLEQ